MRVFDIDMRTPIASCRPSQHHRSNLNKSFILFWSCLTSAAALRMQLPLSTRAHCECNDIFFFSFHRADNELDFMSFYLYSYYYRCSDASVIVRDCHIECGHHVAKSITHEFCARQCHCVICNNAKKVYFWSEKIQLFRFKVSGLSKLANSVDGRVDCE